MTKEINLPVLPDPAKGIHIEFFGKKRNKSCNRRTVNRYRNYLK